MSVPTPTSLPGADPQVAFSGEGTGEGLTVLVSETSGAFPVGSWTLLGPGAGVSEPEGSLATGTSGSVPGCSSMPVIGVTPAAVTLWYMKLSVIPWFVPRWTCTSSGVW